MDLHFYNWNMSNRVQGAFSEEDCNRVIHSCFELEDVIHEQAQLIREGLDVLPEAEGFFQGPKPTCDLYVGEWGNWHGYSFMARPALYQEGTMLDALTSALTLDIFHRNCDKVKLACVAQSVNVLNSLFMTRGAQTLLTPTYHVFDLYQVHRGAEAVESVVETEEKEAKLYTFASMKDGCLYLNVVHTGKTAKEVILATEDGWKAVGVRVLKAADPNEKNTFEDPEHLKIEDGIAPEQTGDGWKLSVPACSISVYKFVI